MKEWRDSSIILNLVSIWRFLVSFTPLPLYLYKQGLHSFEIMYSWMNPRPGIEKRQIH
jgi:hypothetical protein